MLRSLSTVVLFVACLGITGTTATCAFAQGQSHKLIQMAWVTDGAAKQKGLRSRYGILYYFPPAGTNDEHAIFSTEQMCDQSRSSPMVKVKEGDKKIAHLRKEWSIPAKVPVIVVTDWHGNPMQTFAARKLKDKKFKFEQIRSAITGADREATKTERRLAKDLAKGETYLKKRKYPQTIRTLEWAAKIHGFPEAQRAREIMEQVIEVGRERLERALEQPPEDVEAHKKALRKIGKDFKGTPVADEVSDKIREINKAAKDE